jgi:hypothetical protein
MDNLFSWFQSNPWQTGFVSMLVIFVGLPFVVLRHRIKGILHQAVHWRELEQNIPDLGQEEVRYLPHPTRHVLASVLSSQKGTAQAGAVGPALDYLAAAIDSPIRILRSLSYLAILIGLLGTVTMLALALQRVDIISQFRADILKNIYPINAVAIGLAVVIFLSYSWYRHKADQFLLMVARVLGLLRTDQLGGADPVLLATLEKVGEKFKHWGDEIHARYQEKITLLLQEVRELNESILQVVTETVASRREEDQAIAPLIRSQEAKIELLTQMLYQGYARLFPGEETEWEIPADNKPAAGRPQPKKGFLSRYFR